MGVIWNIKKIYLFYKYLRMLNLTIILGPSNKNSLLELALVLASAARILKLELALEGRRNINHEYGLIFGIVLYGL